MANKKRLIDANALGIGKAKREAFDNPAYADGWNSAIEIIENAPTVDAVEVVRCKDCNRSVLQDRFGLESRCCKLDGLQQWVEDNHFCAYGERRTDNA